MTAPLLDHLTLFRALGRTVASDFHSRRSPAACVRCRRQPMSSFTVRARRPAGRVSRRHLFKWRTERALSCSAEKLGEFRISPDGRTVRYALFPDVLSSDVEYVLTGPILSLALQLQGEMLLHAAAVALPEGCFAVAAPQGHGKSTLAASFVQRGYSVLTDDVLPLREHAGRFFARPSVPWIKVRPDSLAAVGESAAFGESAALERVWSGADKRLLPVDAMAGADAECPLGAIYWLILPPNQTRHCRSRLSAPPRLRPACWKTSTARRR